MGTKVSVTSFYVRDKCYIEKILLIFFNLHSNVAIKKVSNKFYLIEYFVLILINHRLLHSKNFIQIDNLRPKLDLVNLVDHPKSWHHALILG